MEADTPPEGEYVQVTLEEAAVQVADRQVADPKQIHLRVEVDILFDWDKDHDGTLLIKPVSAEMHRQLGDYLVKLPVALVVVTDPTSTEPVYVRLFQAETPEEAKSLSKAVALSLVQ